MQYIWIKSIIDRNYRTVDIKLFSNYLFLCTCMERIELHKEISVWMSFIFHLFCMLMENHMLDVNIVHSKEMENHSLNAQLIKLHFKLHWMNCMFVCLCACVHQWRQRTQVFTNFGYLFTTKIKLNAHPTPC